jgi:hypothetical protein
MYLKAGYSVPNGTFLGAEPGPFREGRPLSRARRGI